MSNRIDGIIQDVEHEYGVDLSVDDWPDVLCDGDTCRHSECDCWDWLRAGLEEIAKEKARVDCVHEPKAKMCAGCQ